MSKAQSRANRANAQYSTGPKSISGKARVARNAVRHGATRAPDPAKVMNWFRIIMGVPDLSVADKCRDENTARLALQLAGAEVRLACAQVALDAVLADWHVLANIPDSPHECSWNSRDIRLMRRYVREAQGRRNRAFRCWIEYLSVPGAGEA